MRRTRPPRAPATAAVTWGLALCLTFAAAPVHAQSAAQQAAAQALFDEARALQKQGNLAEACPKFRESFKLEATIGTLINLARCYEQAGRVASAWISYKQVAADAKSAGQLKRERFARKKVTDLEPKLSRLTVSVMEPAEGMRVTVDGEELIPATWGTAIPTDAGELKVTAEAPGKKPWSGEVSLAPNGGAATITVPVLEDLPPPPVEPAPVPEPPPPPPALEGPDETETETDLVMPILGWSAVVLGLGGVGVGVGLRITALDKDDDSLAFCDPDDPTSCDQEGVDLRDDAITMQTGSLIAFIAGGALAAGGVAIVIADMLSEDETTSLHVTPIVGPDVAGLSAWAAF